MDISTADLEILKNQLVGSNLRNLLNQKNLSKWKVAKDCGLTYQTILNWEKERFKPSDTSVIIVARYLGLIKLNEAERFALIKELDELKAKFKRLESN